MRRHTIQLGAVCITGCLLSSKWQGNHASSRILRNQELLDRLGKAVYELCLNMYWIDELTWQTRKLQGSEILRLLVSHPQTISVPSGTLLESSAWLGSGSKASNPSISTCVSDTCSR
jgi:hypothetical protein